jgi:AcrR family transcriptional regulator
LPPRSTYDEKLSRILNASAQVFAQKGFHRASIRDISAETGISLSGLYYYFASKDELLFLIQSNAFETLLERGVAAAAEHTDDPAAALRALVRTHLGYFAANVSEMKVLSHEADSLTGEFAERVLELKRRYVAVVREQLASLLPTREHVDLRVATFALFGQMNWIYNWYRPGRDPDPEALADQLVHGFLHGIRAPMGEPAAVGTPGV